MYVCHRTEEELDDAFARASNEAKAAFGDGAMFAEKCAQIRIPHFPALII